MSVNTDEDKKPIDGAGAFNHIKSIKDIYKQKIKGLFGGDSSNQNQDVHDISPKKKKGNVSNGIW